MYIGIGILVIICFIFFYLKFYRKPCVVRKVRCLCPGEKCRILSALIRPMGFAYDARQDIFTSRIDAWQRHYSYCGFFDRIAPFFQMVFDWEPVYFDYRETTWMIEFWKGQYGINTGAEVGIYNAGTLLSPQQRTRACFHPAEDEEMLPVGITLYKKGRPLFLESRRHWWLTGFCMGMFSRPEELAMAASITFPDKEMMHAFVNALRENGHCKESFCIDNLTVTLFFDTPRNARCGPFRRIICAVAQCKNRLFCKLYCWITRPFCKSIDRLLYLYYFLPFAFRKTVTIRKPKKRRRKIS